MLALVFLFNVSSADYFGIGRKNILYDAVYLVGGGLIYLYRINLTEFSKKHRIATSTLVILFAAMYYTVGAEILTMLCLYSSILIYAMGVHKKGILLNRYIKFLSTISIEIYLGHMVCFRIIERIGLTRSFENDLVSFALATGLTVMGSVVFSVTAKWGFRKVESFIRKLYAMYAGK